MESLIPLLTSLITGGVGGNIVGALFKKLSLGMLGNTIAGVAGGGLGGQLLSGPLGGLLGAGASSGMLGQVAGSALGGGGLLVIVGLIKKMMSK